MSVAALVAAALAACAPQADAPAAECRPVAGADWRRTATDADRDRLRDWRDSWTAALDAVRASGEGAALAPYGPLMEPDRALADPLPPPGAYRCRAIRLGARTPGQPQIAPQPPQTCVVARDGDRLTLRQGSGQQRGSGMLYADTPARGILLGTLMIGDEQAALSYGQDRARDVAGIIERVADRRWRLTLPRPAFDSLLDVIELTPAG